jgi:hypothetical protein
LRSLFAYFIRKRFYLLHQDEISLTIKGVTPAHLPRIKIINHGPVGTSISSRLCFFFGY